MATYLAAKNVVFVVCFLKRNIHILHCRQADIFHRISVVKTNFWIEKWLTKLRFGLVGALNPILGLLELHHRLAPNNLDFGVCDFLAVWLLHFQFWTLDFESQSLVFGSWTLSFGFSTLSPGLRFLSRELWTLIFG